MSSVASWIAGLLLLFGITATKEPYCPSLSQPQASRNPDQVIFLGGIPDSGGPYDIFSTWSHIRRLGDIHNDSLAIQLRSCRNDDFQDVIGSQNDISCICCGTECDNSRTARSCGSDGAWMPDLLKRNNITDVVYITDTDIEALPGGTLYAQYPCDIRREDIGLLAKMLVTVVIDCKTPTLTTIFQHITYGPLLLNPFMNVIALSPVDQELFSNISNIPLNIAAVVTGTDRQCSLRYTGEIYNHTGTLSQVPGELDCDRGDARLSFWSRGTHVTSQGFETVPASNIRLLSEISGFNRRKFRIGTLLYDPFVSYDERTRTYGGYCMDILEMLSDMLDFRYELVNLGNRWGYVDDNGTWHGSIRYIMDGDVDMVVTGLAMYSEREEVVDFSYPYWVERTALLTTTKPDGSFKLFAPLDLPVWVSFLAAALVVSSVFYFFEVTVPLQHVYPRRSSFKTLADCFWYISGACVFQGGAAQPVVGRSRLVVTWMWVVVVVVLASYSGTIMSFLTVTHMVLPFSTLDEVLQADDYMLRINYQSYLLPMLQNAQEGVFADTWSKIKQNYPESIFESVPGAVSEMFEDNNRHVIIGFGTNLRTVATRSGHCDWDLLDETTLPIGFGIAFQQGSPYKSLIDYAIIRLHEAGLLQYLKKRHWSFLEEDNCAAALEVEASLLGLTDVWGTFLVLAGGIGLASISLIIEHIMHRTQS